MTPTCMTDSVEADQRNYFAQRAANISYDKKTSIARKLGMEDDAPPYTAIEFIKRIQDGKFIPPGEKRNGTSIHDIIWRDPSIKKDPDGYFAAIENFDKEYNFLQDRLMVAPLADLPKLIQDWAN